MSAPHFFIGYGAFPGGDPRCFSPDKECSTEAERAQHAADCAAAATGKLAFVMQAHVWTEEGHLARAGYGLGTYRVSCDCPRDSDHYDWPDEEVAP